MPFSTLTKTDHNGAFELYPSIDRLTELGFDVRYYEANDENAARKAMEHATKGGKNKADAIVFAGHGTVTTLALGGDDLRQGGEMGDETKYVDTYDFAGGRDDLNGAGMTGAPPHPDPLPKGEREFQIYA